MDRQFRLLRQDFLAKLKDDVKDCLTDGNNQRRLFMDPKFFGFNYEKGLKHPMLLFTAKIPAWLVEKKKGMSYNEVEDFFRNGFGKSICDDTSLFVFCNKLERFKWDYCLVGHPARADINRNFINNFMRYNQIQFGLVVSNHPSYNNPLTN